MTTPANEYRPDYAVPPGWVLKERLDVHGISQAEFARRCGRSPKLISEIVSGKAPVDPETALQFERVLGVDAGIWLGIDADYRLHGAREAQARAAENAVAWSRTLPVSELVTRRAIEKPSSEVDAVSNLLSFFGVASVDAWHAKYGAPNVAYRHSPSFESDETALATWLRLGELDAERQPCADYDASRFRRALHGVRKCTRKPVPDALKEAQALLNEAGVVLAVVKPLRKTALSGAAWWLTPRRALIQLSVRHKTNDHLWFSFFHEAAHILLHSKKDVFVDGARTDGTDIEREANAWASDFLVSRQQWKTFIASARFSKNAVRRFANSQEIAPGIVVGMLQHGRHLPWSHLNDLKVRLQWVEHDTD